MQDYYLYPNNNTFFNMKYDCVRQIQDCHKTQEQIGWTGQHDPNTGEPVGQFNLSNISNEATQSGKMMVQAFCVGIENGPNYNNVTGDWQLVRMYSIYSSVVDNIVKSRVTQETDYFKAVVPGIFTTCVTHGRTTSQFRNYGNCIWNALVPHYQWDRFGIVIADADCIDYNSGHVGTYGDAAGVSGSQPYSVFINNDGQVVAYVIRFWEGAEVSPTKESAYKSCMQANGDKDLPTWAHRLSCGESFAVLSNNWWCGQDTVHIGRNTYYYANAVSSPFANTIGTSSAVFPSPTRRTTVQYDLGFWERPISIQLLTVTNQ